MLHILIILVIKLFAVGRRNTILRCNADVTVPGVALVDGALGVGTARLTIDVESVIIHGIVSLLLRHGVV